MWNTGYMSGSGRKFFKFFLIKHTHMSDH